MEYKNVPIKKWWSWIIDLEVEISPGVFKDILYQKTSSPIVSQVWTESWMNGQLEGSKTLSTHTTGNNKIMSVTDTLEDIV